MWDILLTQANPNENIFQKNVAYFVKFISSQRDPESNYFDFKAMR